MVISMPRTVVILIYLGLLTVHPDNASGIRSIDIALRWGSNSLSLVQKNQRILEEVVMKELNTEMRAAPIHKKPDTFQSSKRTVGKGSDPIHNRS